LTVVYNTRVSGEEASALHRVAHVFASSTPDDGRGQYLKILVASLRNQGIESMVFDTGSAVAQDEAMDRARSIAETIRAANVQVAFFHSGLPGLMTAVLAAGRLAPIQVNVNHRSDIAEDLFDGHIHLFRHAMHRTGVSSQLNEWIPMVSDVEARLRTAEPVTKHALGLDPASTVSATFGNLSDAASNGYLRMLSEILNRFPKHIHLFAGPGNVKGIRSFLHSEGILPRVRFLGQLGDVAPLLGVLDVFLASFPRSNSSFVLDAMGAGKPVVALRFPDDSENNSAAELVSIDELTPRTEGQYIHIVESLLRNETLRQTRGRAMLDRFCKEFRPELLGERYKTFLAAFRRPARGDVL
jgi:Glycosyl transferases group 1